MKIGEVERIPSAMPLAGRGGYHVALGRFAVGLAGIWLAMAGLAEGLTVYRLGGQGLPPPELPGAFNFVQLPWIPVEEGRHGRAELLEAEQEFIRPRQLDPAVNLTPLLEQFGGQIWDLSWLGWVPIKEDHGTILDRDPNTAFLSDGHLGPPRKAWMFDFGGPFFIRRLRFYPRLRFADTRFVERFAVGISDGDPLKEGTRQYNLGLRDGRYFDFDIISQATENTRSTIDLELPSQPIRRLLFEAPENVRGIWEIAEFEIFGNGFAPRATYTSNIIDLGQPAGLGDLSWAGQQPPGTSVALSMRSGNDADPDNYWRRTFRGDERSRLGTDGRPLTLERYAQLEPVEQAGITYDTEYWDFWTPPYEFGQAQGAMAGFEPRQYLQFRAEFSSGEQAGGQVDWLQFAVSMPPVVSQVLAEIWPAVVPAAQPVRFTCVLRPEMNADDLGFDHIEIDTPVRPLSVEAVRLNRQEVEFAVTRLDERGFALRMPRIDAKRTGEFIEVVFQAEVFEFGAVFPVRVFDGSRPLEVHQRVTPGDADPLVDSNRLQVELEELGGRIAQEVRVLPAVFTPNGDGINDQASIEYDLVNLGGQAPVSVELYDLTGARVRRLVEGTARSGPLSVAWDGRDDQGRRVTPGIYLARLRVEPDRGAEVVTRLVAVVY